VRLLGSFLREVFITLLIALVLFLGIHYSIQNSEVIGYSMEPNLHTGERVLINKLAYRFGNVPHRGDIIVLIPPESLSSENDYIKRVIGLPGERVELRDGKVYIHPADGNIFALDETYVPNPSMQNYTSDVILPGRYFVMGDNRNNSSDSRGGWTVRLDDIVGKAWLVTWPPSDIGLAPNYSLPSG
jgi:signal peptidase I